jgi:hypothetical protein
VKEEVVGSLGTLAGAAAAVAQRAKEALAMASRADVDHPANNPITVRMAMQA